MYEISKPVAITVSRGYSDILPLTLKHNQGLFKEWYIVTSEDDLETRRLIKDHGATEILFNFQGGYRGHDGRSWVPFFNKGGAIRQAQLRAHEEHPGSWYLIMDTDIIIRSLRDLNTRHLVQDKLYGAQTRFDYRSYSEYLEGRYQYQRKMWQEDLTVIGFFQLYKDHSKLYPNSQDTRVDGDFSKLWPKTDHELLSISVDHLGYWAPEVQDTTRGRPWGNGWLG